MIRVLKIPVYWNRNIDSDAAGNKNFCSLQHWLLLSFMSISLLLGSEANVLAENADNQVSSATVDPTELLEAGPVENNTPAVSQDMIEPETDNAAASDDQPYPVTSWTPQPTPTAVAAVSNEPISTILLSPYYFSSYIPKLDKTEVALGLVLSQHPGINAAIAWGAMEELMAGAKVTVQGASYVAGIRLKYLLRPEQQQESKPGFAAVAGWRVQNQQTDDEQRATIYRGNRIYIGAIASKDFGSLAKSLEAEPTIANFFSYFKIHFEAIAEFQTGRINETEDELGRLEFGLRNALEIVIDPKQLYVVFAYQSLSDWINGQDRYMGVRWYAREDFSLDVIGGWFGHQPAVNVSLVWLF